MKLTKLLFVSRTYIVSEYDGAELAEFRTWLTESPITYTMSQGMITVHNDDDELMLLIRWAKTND